MQVRILHLFYRFREMVMETMCDVSSKHCQCLFCLQLLLHSVRLHFNIAILTDFIHDKAIYVCVAQDEFRRLHCIFDICKTNAQFRERKIESTEDNS